MLGRPAGELDSPSLPVRPGRILAETRPGRLYNTLAGAGLFPTLMAYFDFGLEPQSAFANLYARVPTTLPLGTTGSLSMRKITIEEKWHQQAEAAKKEAEKLPYGRERENLLRIARQLQTASQINQWLSSPELKPPE